VAMLGRDVTVRKKYADLSGHAERASLAHSELIEVIARTRSSMAESRALIAKADAILDGWRVLIVAQNFPTARFTMRNTPCRTQREIEELNRRFEMVMAKMHPRDRELLADWFAGWMAVYPDFCGASQQPRRFCARLTAERA
jgi:hypothetical protein